MLGEPSVPDTIDDIEANASNDDTGGGEELLQFSTPRLPGLLSRFISLRVLQPERYAWLRGLEAALAYHRAHGNLRVPYDYRSPVAPDSAPDDGFPLGTWIVLQRRERRAGRLSAERSAKLDTLGIVWSPFDAAFEEGLTACRNWFAAHGHLLPPIDAVDPDTGFPLGRWLKNQRAAVRTADEPSGCRSPRATRNATPQPRPTAVGKHWRRSTRPGVPPGRWTGSVPSISPGLSPRPGTP
ncbi:helicase associated domain-containing protein [Streptomyces sp. V1I1]|uniref:helicase associated domain-containing protein n=1 Tax=Streptomyces sp. V1I1 TaxID=3042272 RepID=UPI0027839130|nr:helicase associated domain-containing protein [Streptomyces sp. V1I1]MDQ0945908.1 hypothetical protein [Streptomyces sp. V1I1]